MTISFDIPRPHSGENKLYTLFYSRLLRRYFCPWGVITLSAVRGFIVDDKKTVQQLGVRFCCQLIDCLKHLILVMVSL